KLYCVGVQLSIRKSSINDDLTAVLFSLALLREILGEPFSPLPLFISLPLLKLSNKLVRCQTFPEFRQFLPRPVEHDRHQLLGHLNIVVGGVKSILLNLDTVTLSNRDELMSALLVFVEDAGEDAGV